MNVNSFVYSTDTTAQMLVDPNFSAPLQDAEDGVDSALAVLESQREEDGRDVADIIS